MCCMPRSASKVEPLSEAVRPSVCLSHAPGLRRCVLELYNTNRRRHDGSRTHRSEVAKTSMKPTKLQYLVNQGRSSLHGLCWTWTEVVGCLPIVCRGRRCKGPKWPSTEHIVCRYLGDIACYMTPFTSLFCLSADHFRLFSLLCCSTTYVWNSESTKTCWLTAIVLPFRRSSMLV